MAESAGEGSVADTEVEEQSREDSPPPEFDEETVTDTDGEGRREEQEEEREETGSQAGRIAVMANLQTPGPRGSDTAAAPAADGSSGRFHVEGSFWGSSSPVVTAAPGEEVRLDPKAEREAADGEGMPRCSLGRTSPVPSRSMLYLRGDGVGAILEDVDRLGEGGSNGCVFAFSRYLGLHVFSPLVR